MEFARGLQALILDYVLIRCIGHESGHAFGDAIADAAIELAYADGGGRGILPLFVRLACTSRRQALARVAP
jgi:hypothetical protein